MAQFPKNCQITKIFACQKKSTYHYNSLWVHQQFIHQSTCIFSLPTKLYNFFFFLFSFYFVDNSFKNNPIASGCIISNLDCLLIAWAKQITMDNFVSNMLENSSSSETHTIIWYFDETSVPPRPGWLQCNIGFFLSCCLQNFTSHIRIQIVDRMRSEQKISREALCP